MPSFIRENISIIAAIILPLLFAGFFLIAKNIDISGTEPLRHDFLIAQDHRNYDNPLIEIIDQKLSVKFRYPVKPSGNETQPIEIHTPQFYLVKAATMIAEPIAIPLPEDAYNPPTSKEGKQVEIKLEQFADMKFNAAAISPDGYELAPYSYRSGNLMTEIFSAGSHQQRPALVKDGKTVEIKGLDNNYNLQIVGWIVKDQE